MRVGSFIIWIYLLAIAPFACSQSNKKSTNQGSIETSISEAYSEFNIIFHQDFENTTIGIYDYNQWARDWNNPPFGDNYRKRTEIVNYNAGGRSSRGMKWIFPKNTYRVNADNGYIWWAPLGEDQIEIYLSYSIMFKPGFQSVKGGKIPGLREEHTWSGERPRWEAGYKGSLMFKPGEDGAPKPVFYLYHHDQQLETVGDTKYWNGYTFDVKEETWYDITYRVVMNTATATDISGPDGKKDGIVEGYVNGVLWGQVTGLRLRNLVTLGTDQIAVNAFFGGSNDDWATVRDEWMMFDNFYVWTYSDEFLQNHPSVSRGRQANSLKDEIYTPFDVLFGNNKKKVDESMIPTGLNVIDAREQSATISWDPVSNFPGMTGYKIYLNGNYLGVTGDTTYTLDQLLPSSSYTVAVSSYDLDSNESPKSPAITVITQSLDNLPPSAPSNLSANQVTSYSFQLSWDNSVDNVEIERYMIFIDGTPTFSTYQNYIEISKLQPSTTYDISIKAFDTSNNPSPLSEVMHVTTAVPDTEPPSAPTGLNVTRVSEESIALVWEPSADNVGVRDYKIYMNSLEWQSSTRTESIVTRLQPGITYDVTVSAVDEGANESPQSLPITVTTINSDITTNPTLPAISIVQVLKNTSTPSTISEMSSFGYAEIQSYGIEIFEKGNPFSESITLVETSNSQVINDSRVEMGLQAMYNFSEGEGTIIRDISGVSPPLDLTIDHNAANTKWLRGQGLRVSGNTRIIQTENTGRLIESISNTSAITIEAWIKQEEKQQKGPAGIVALSSYSDARSVALSHEGNEAYYNYISNYNSNLESIETPELKTAQNFISSSLHHVVYTRDKHGQEKIYINGLAMASGFREENFSSLNEDCRFTLANDITGGHPWKGTYYLVAVYNTALSSEEVNQNYRAGVGKIRFATALDTLSSNVSYDLFPFIQTDQGLVYGELKDFLNQNVAETDNLLAVYPNPTTDGNITVKIKHSDQNVDRGQLQIADYSGKVYYSKLIDLSEKMYENVIYLQLPGSLKNGLYTLIFNAGLKTAAEKIILLK